MSPHDQSPIEGIEVNADGDEPITQLATAQQLAVVDQRLGEARRSVDASLSVPSLRVPSMHGASDPSPYAVPPTSTSPDPMATSRRWWWAAAAALLILGVAAVASRWVPNKSSQMATDGIELDEQGLPYFLPPADAAKPWVRWNPGLSGSSIDSRLVEINDAWFVVTRSYNDPFAGRVVDNAPVALEFGVTAKWTETQQGDGSAPRTRVWWEAETRPAPAGPTWFVIESMEEVSLEEATRAANAVGMLADAPESYRVQWLDEATTRAVSAISVGIVDYVRPARGLSAADLGVTWDRAPGASKSLDLAAIVLDDMGFDASLNRVGAILDGQRRGGWSFQVCGGEGEGEGGGYVCLPEDTSYRVAFPYGDDVLVSADRPSVDEAIAAIEGLRPVSAAEFTDETIDEEQFNESQVVDGFRVGPGETTLHTDTIGDWSYRIYTGDPDRGGDDVASPLVDFSSASGQFGTGLPGAATLSSSTADGQTSWYAIWPLDSPPPGTRGTVTSGAHSLPVGLWTGNGRTYVIAILAADQLAWMAPTESLTLQVEGQPESVPLPNPS